jgi:hypothetical protein
LELRDKLNDTARKIDAGDTTQRNSDPNYDGYLSEADFYNDPRGKRDQKKFRTDWAKARKQVQEIESELHVARDPKTIEALERDLQLWKMGGPEARYNALTRGQQWAEDEFGKAALHTIKQTLTQKLGVMHDKFPTKRKHFEPTANKTESDNDE